MSYRKPIRASDIAEFVYCRRAWYLTAQGIEPALHRIELRDAGVEYHREHGRRVASAKRLGSAAQYVLWLVIVSALGYWLYSSFR